MPKNTDEIETSDYKTTASGKKVRAHRIVFNKGEEDDTKLREECGSKTYKGFNAKYGKDRKNKMKEETEMENNLDEAKKANSASARAELAKRPAKPLTGADADKKKKESDDAWERLMAHAASMKKEEVELDEELVNEVSDTLIKAAIKKHAQKASDHASKAEDALDRHRESDSDSDYEEHEHHADQEEHHMNKIAKLKSKLKEELKGNQHKLDKNKNGKLDKKDFELIRKEETEQVEERVKGFAQKPAPTGSKSDSPGFQEYLKKQREKRAAAAAAAGSMKKEEIEMMDEAHPFDIPKSSGMATSTKTKHDIKKTSTGTVYTKQRDADGMAKEFKRDPDEAKRGRGRPKKNSFAEAAEFLMSLDEAMFDSLMEDGFDAFVEHYEQLDELSKSTLSSYVKKAADDRADTGYHSGYWDRAHGGSKPEYKSQAEKEDGQEKRKAGIHKALHRLTK